VKLGRVGELKLEDARKRVVTCRGQAKDGISKNTFGDVATGFIERYCKTDMRAWNHFEGLLKGNCQSPWSKPSTA
jgi:hypothetical protein